MLTDNSYHIRGSKGELIMNNKPYLIVSGIIFGLSTIGQSMRLIFQIPVQIGAINMPVWSSVIGLIVVSPMCIWAIRLASK